MESTNTQNDRVSYPPITMTVLNNNIRDIYIDIINNKFYHIYDVFWIENRAYYTGVTFIIMGVLFGIIYLYKRILFQESKSI